MMGQRKGLLGLMSSYFTDAQKSEACPPYCAAFRPYDFEFDAIITDSGVHHGNDADAVMEEARAQDCHRDALDAMGCGR